MILLQSNQNKKQNHPELRHREPREIFIDQLDSAFDGGVTYNYIPSDRELKSNK